MKRALIIGSEGQDGRLLAERLGREGVAVSGLSRAGLRELGSLIPLALQDGAAMHALIEGRAPDAIFYLAAFHHSAQQAAAIDFAALYARSHEVHVLGLLNVLEAMRATGSSARLFYAASSHCFGDVSGGLQNKSTPFRPVDAYGVTKTAGVHLCRLYRTLHGVHASCGFLYNHESPLRPAQFLSTKIARGAAEIAAGLRCELVLGDLNARIDWGYAPDVVDAMIRIVGLPQGDDYVVATGESHSVEEFVETAFSDVGLDWRSYVRVDPGLIAKRRAVLVGDASKLRAATGWGRSISFAEMARLLVEAQRVEIAETVAHVG